MNTHRPTCVDRCLLLGLALLLCGLAAGETFDDSAQRHIEYPAWFTDDPFNDMQETLRQASADGKQGLMVLFTTEGCAYCERFIRTSLGDAAIAARVQRSFDAIGLEIFDDAEMTDPRGAALPVKAFAEREGAAFSPTLLFIGTDGAPVLRVVGYQSPARFRVILDYVAGAHYRSGSLRDYVARHDDADAPGDPPPSPQAAALRDDPLFAPPPYMLDRSRIAADRPLLILFEATGCAACEDFHRDVLAITEVRAALAAFEVVRLDARDGATPVMAPDGSRTTPSALFDRLGFTRAPALAFFDERGHAVLETDALVLRQRMLNALLYVREGAYDRGWTFQRFARTKGLERLRDAAGAQPP